MFYKHPDMKTELKAIGYWCRNINEKSNLPYPSEFIDENWDKDELLKVAEYIQCCEPIEYWRGFSTCRLCGECLGTTCLSDGTYIFPEKFEHYLLEHNVKPPQEFIDHVLANQSNPDFIKNKKSLDLGKELAKELKR